MQSLNHQTKIVATLGPASSSPEVLKQMLKAGMNVARLNFSHGKYEDHAQRIAMIRAIAEELDTPITLLQDLQGPKVRVGQLPEGEMSLTEGQQVTLVPVANYDQHPDTIPIDYAELAADAQPGIPVLLDDGLLELRTEAIADHQVQCRVIQGGLLKSRKGVNLPSLDLRLPSMTEKDRQDLEFGLSQGVDYISLSFVRRAEDILTLKALLTELGAADTPVVAKIEKPQAIHHLESILDVCDAVMVARGDLGVEMSPEKVPLLQKRIIRECNLRGLPVITATQMLESMIHNPRPTRAEASDVANAVMDGTDAVMLSGESAVGSFPTEAVKMLAKIAIDIEPSLQFVNHPPAKTDETNALSQALNAICEVMQLRCIVSFTTTGYTARLAAGERPKVPIIALTPNPRVYHRLNLFWGVRPLLMEAHEEPFEVIITQAEKTLLQRNWVDPGDKVLIMGGVPVWHPQGTNFLKIHTIAG